MLLTDEEIYATWGAAKNEAYSFREFARAIESAVLEKLREQEPMCWTNDTELSYSQFKRPDGELTSGSFWAEYHEDCDIPLYTHPLPPADVVRDPRVAELEAVLRECRDALMPHMDYVLPGILNHPAQCVAKIDEVLNEDR